MLIFKQIGKNAIFHFFVRYHKFNHHKKLVSGTALSEHFSQVSIINNNFVITKVSSKIHKKHLSSDFVVIIALLQYETNTYQVVQT